MQVEMTRLLSAGRRLIAGLAIAGLLGSSLSGAVLAQDDTAAAGNGGTVTSSANGGAVGMGSTNSGDTSGGVTVVAGDSVSAEDIIAAVYAALGLDVPE
ncbi:MAG: hypothetical protein M3464_08565 [Chloroflexota bacterium]|nr:hypothetical protein [Chloroflexota bacterium]